MLQQSVITLLVVLPLTLCHMSIHVILNENESPTINHYGESITPLNSADLGRFLQSNETLPRMKLNVNAGRSYIKDSPYSGNKEDGSPVTTITKPVNAFVQSIDAIPFTYKNMLNITKNINTTDFSMSYKTIPNTVTSTWLNNETQHDGKKIFYKFQFPGIEKPKTKYYSDIFGANIKLKSIFHPTTLEKIYETEELNTMICGIKLVVIYEVELAGCVLYRPEAETKWYDFNYLITGVHGAPAKYVAAQSFTIYYHWIPTPPKEASVKPSTNSE